MKERPKVGLGVIIIKDNRILLGKRKNAHGDGTWCPPGGHLEFGETLDECAKREISEETGLIIKNLRLGPITNDIFKQENKHYITIHMMADWESGIPQVLETEKCETWNWFEFDNLPTPLFLPIENLLKDFVSLSDLLNHSYYSNRWENKPLQI